jgi:hypothetical protein
MAFTIETPTGIRIRVDMDAALIGRDQSCQVAMPDEAGLQAIHAKIRRVADRWLIESLGEWQIQVGSAPPGRMSWLQSGDGIRLGEGGPEVVFWTDQPTQHASERHPPPSQRTESTVKVMGWLEAVPPADSPPPGDEWFYEKSGKRLGPFTLAELQRLVESGVLTLQDTVCKGETSNGVPAHSVQALRAASLGLSSFLRVTEDK